MTKEKAQDIIKDRFWIFHSKLVNQYQVFFDTVVSDAQDNGVLWEVLEFADHYLKHLKDENGGQYALTEDHYIKALEYGYSEWIK